MTENQSLTINELKDYLEGEVSPKQFTIVESYLDGLATEQPAPSTTQTPDSSTDSNQQPRQ